MTATRLHVIGLGMLVAVGCSGPELAVDKNYCERGHGDSSDTDCIYIRNEKDADPTTVGRLSVKSRVGAPVYVRRAGKKKYTLHRDGKIAGSIVMTGSDADWIEVTLTDGAPYRKAMRVERPGGWME